MSQKCKQEISTVCFLFEKKLVNELNKLANHLKYVQYFRISGISNVMTLREMNPTRISQSKAVHRGESWDAVVVAKASYQPE